VAQAEAERDTAAERLRLSRLEVRGELDRALAAVDETRARVEALQGAAVQYAEVARVEKLRLDTGVGMQTEYLDAESKLLDARAALVESEHSVVVARIEVARITGELGVAWIQTMLEAGRTAVPSPAELTTDDSGRAVAAGRATTR
jgi:outer membrane protein TolC